MEIIVPERTNDDTLIFASGGNDKTPDYNATTTYSINDVVEYNATNIHWYVRSLADNNLGNTPTGLSSDTKWVKISETNKWKMFDLKSTSRTVENPLEVKIKGVNMVDAVYLGNLVADNVEVNVYDMNNTLVYSNSESLVDTSGINNIYDFFFAPVVVKTDIAFVDLPPYAGAVYEIKIVKSSTLAECGIALIGKRTELGGTIFGMTRGIQDYSVKTIDEFGDLVLTERSYSKLLELQVSVENSKYNTLVNMFDKLRATPIVWLGAKEFAGSYIYGFYDNYIANTNRPTHSDFSFDIKGLS